MKVQIEDEDIVLEVPCPSVDCSFGLNRHNKPCSTCDGQGMVQTPMGEKIARHVVKFGPRLKREFVELKQMRLEFTQYMQAETAKLEQLRKDIEKLDQASYERNKTGK
jgi:hypothetical protein